MAEILKFKNNFNDELINNYFDINNDRSYEKIYLLNIISDTFVKNELTHRSQYNITVITELSSKQVNNDLKNINNDNINILNNQTPKFVAMKYVESSDIILLITNDNVAQLDIIVNNNLQETLLNYKKIIISKGLSIKTLEELKIVNDLLIDKRYSENIKDGLPLDYYLILDKYGIVEYKAVN